MELQSSFSEDSRVSSHTPYYYTMRGFFHLSAIYWHTELIPLLVFSAFFFFSYLGYDISTSHLYHFLQFCYLDFLFSVPGTYLPQIHEHLWDISKDLAFDYERALSGNGDSRPWRTRALTCLSIHAACVAEWSQREFGVSLSHPVNSFTGQLLTNGHFSQGLFFTRYCGLS